MKASKERQKVSELRLNIANSMNYIHQTNTCQLQTLNAKKEKKIEVECNRKTYVRDLSIKEFKLRHSIHLGGRQYERSKS